MNSLTDKYNSFHIYLLLIFGDSAKELNNIYWNYNFILTVSIHQYWHRIIVIFG